MVYNNSRWWQNSKDFWELVYFPPHNANQKRKSLAKICCVENLFYYFDSTNIAKKLDNKINKNEIQLNINFVFFPVSSVLNILIKEKYVPCTFVLLKTLCTKENLLNPFI